MAKRRGHYRYDSRAGKRVWVEEHDVATTGGGTALASADDLADAADSSDLVDTDPLGKQDSTLQVNHADLQPWDERAHEKYTEGLERHAEHTRAEYERAEMINRQAKQRKVDEVAQALDEGREPLRAVQPAHEQLTDEAMSELMAGANDNGYQQALENYIKENCDDPAMADRLLRMRSGEKPPDLEGRVVRNVCNGDDEFNTIGLRAYPNPSMGYSPEMIEALQAGYEQRAKNSPHLAELGDRYEQAVEAAEQAKPHVQELETQLRWANEERDRGFFPSEQLQEARSKHREATRQLDDARELHARGLPSDATMLRGSADDYAIGKMAANPDGATNVKVVSDDGHVRRVVGFGTTTGNSGSAATLKLNDGSSLSGRTSYAKQPGRAYRTDSGPVPPGHTVVVTRPQPGAAPPARDDGKPVTGFHVTVDSTD